MGAIPKNRTAIRKWRDPEMENDLIFFNPILSLCSQLRGWHYFRPLCHATGHFLGVILGEVFLLAIFIRRVKARCGRHGQKVMGSIPGAGPFLGLVQNWSKYWFWLFF